MFCRYAFRRRSDQAFLAFCYLPLGSTNVLMDAMKFIIGYKQEMTQLFREDGTVVAVTVVKVEPCIVTQIKTKDSDGYEAVQLGVGNQKHPGKAMEGHVKGILATGRKPFNRMREIRLESAGAYKVGDLIAATSFEAGDVVEAVGTSKGKGFQGVVKRHGFAGHHSTRGTKDQERMPGSLASKRQGAVQKGKRMAGRMGGDRITIKNLEIVRIEADKNVVYVKGALPGARHALVILQGKKGESQATGNVLSAPQAAKVEAAAPSQVATPAAA